MFPLSPWSSSKLFTVFYHLVGPPFILITAYRCAGIEVIKFSKKQAFRFSYVDWITAYITFFKVRQGFYWAI